MPSRSIAFPMLPIAILRTLSTGTDNVAGVGVLDKYLGRYAIRISHLPS